MNADFIFHLEIKLLITELVFICAWVVFSSIPIKTIIAALVSVLIIFAAFRPPDYNSDTLNYASYVLSLSLEKGANTYFLTKLEPLHVLLINLTRSFQIWLIAEAILALTMLWILWSKCRQPSTFLVISSFFSTLYTSSMRFAIAILVVGALLTWKSRSKGYLALVSVLSGCVHAIMLVAGPLATRIKWVPLAITGAFFVATIMSASIRGRIGSDLSDVATIGLKSFVTFVAICGYLWVKSQGRNVKGMLWDIVGFTGVFVVTALFFPGINRIIIVGGIVILFDAETNPIYFQKDSWIARAIVLFMCLMIILPYLYFVPDLYKYNMW